jgi:hypothetical protein
VQPASACPEGVHAISRVAGEAQSAGNLGIGTTGPAENLHVWGNARIGGITGGSPTSPYLDLFNAGMEQWRLGTTGSSFFIGNTGAKVTIQQGGNVGIGTTVPSEKLEVNGNVKISPLSGSGNAYACINSAGVIYRSASPCN